MFKIFNGEVAIDTKKITALHVDNFGTNDKYYYSVRVSMDNEDDWTLAEFKNDADAAKNYLAQIVAELNADT